MNIFDMNRPIVQPTVPPIRDMYIQVSHNYGRSMKNMIGMVVNQLVGMGQNYCMKGPVTNCVYKTLRVRNQVLPLQTGREGWGASL